MVFRLHACRNPRPNHVSMNIMIQNIFLVVEILLNKTKMVIDSSVRFL